MQTKMKVVVTIKGHIDSHKLYNQLQPYNLNVTDLGDKTLVYATIDIKEATIENILNVCGEYGECEVEARMVKDKTPPA